MIQLDMYSSFAIGGTASLLGLIGMSVTRVEHTRMQYALTLFRWAFLFMATTWLAILAPADRARLVFQAVLGCVAMGMVLLGWGTRQMHGKRTPPWLGWGLTSVIGMGLWLSAWGTSESIYATVLFGVLSLVSVAILVDQAWTMYRGAKVSYGEWAFLALIAISAVDGLIGLIYSAIEPGPPPEHWIRVPAWWELVSVILHALFPLAAAGSVLAIVNERLALQLRTRALSDELTGALSRRGLRELGERLIHHARSRSQQVAVLMLDMDHFKKINATYGHLVGDDVLRHVVYVMQERLRDDALLARYGGEEFAVLLPIRHPQEAAVVAERLKNAVEHKPAQTLAGLIEVTISVGGAFLPSDVSLEQALATADARLYDAKNQGRNCIVIDGVPQPAPAPSSAPEIAHT